MPDQIQSTAPTVTPSMINDVPQAHVVASAINANTVGIAQNTADVKSASTDATTAKITAIGSAVAVAIGAIFLGITQIAPYFVAKPGPIQVVNCPCAEKQAKPVLVDPAILTDDQKAKIKTNGPK